MCLDRFSHGNDRIDENNHLRWTKARRDPVLGAATSCLVFQSQSDVCQHLDFTSTGGHQ
jgi:hypothetical protein